MTNPQQILATVRRLAPGCNVSLAYYDTQVLVATPGPAVRSEMLDVELLAQRYARWPSAFADEQTRDELRLSGLIPPAQK